LKTGDLTTPESCFKKIIWKVGSMEEIFIIAGLVIVFFITSIIMCWIRTWKRIDRIRSELKKDLEKW